MVINFLHVPILVRFFFFFLTCLYLFLISRWIALWEALYKNKGNNGQGGKITKNNA